MDSLPLIHGLRLHGRDPTRPRFGCGRWWKGEGYLKKKRRGEKMLRRGCWYHRWHGRTPMLCAMDRQEYGRTGSEDWRLWMERVEARARTLFPKPRRSRVSGWVLFPFFSLSFSSWNWGSHGRRGMRLVDTPFLLFVVSYVLWMPGCDVMRWNGQRYITSKAPYLTLHCPLLKTNRLDIWRTFILSFLPVLSPESKL